MIDLSFLEKVATGATKLLNKVRKQNFLINQGVKADFSGTKEDFIRGGRKAVAEAANPNIRLSNSELLSLNKNRQVISENSAKMDEYTKNRFKNVLKNQHDNYLGNNTNTSSTAAQPKEPKPTQVQEPVKQTPVIPPMPSEEEIANIIDRETQKVLGNMGQEILKGSYKKLRNAGLAVGGASAATAAGLAYMAGNQDEEGHKKVASKRRGMSRATAAFFKNEPKRIEHMDNRLAAQREQEALAKAKSQSLTTNVGEVMTAEQKAKLEQERLKHEEYLQQARNILENGSLTAVNKGSQLEDLIREFKGHNPRPLPPNLDKLIKAELGEAALVPDMPTAAPQVHTFTYTNPKFKGRR